MKIRQSYKILHIETGLYLNSNIGNFNLKTYKLSEIPSIFTYKIPYLSMTDRKLNKILKNLIWHVDNNNLYGRKMDKCEFIIMEIDDV